VRGEEKLQATAGMMIRSQDTVRTFKYNTIKLQYRHETTIIELKESTRVKFWNEGISKRVQVTRGKVACDVDQQPEGSPMVMFTPHARVKILGTRFTLAVKPVWQEKERVQGTLLDVHEGRVELKPQINAKLLF